MSLHFRERLFVMESLPPSLRARSSGVNSVFWNPGWSASAGGAAASIARWSYEAPFYVAAELYAKATISFYLSFRRFPRRAIVPGIGEGALSIGIQEVR
jgi:predicted MFS family arabinose efflux permease